VQLSPKIGCFYSFVIAVHTSHLEACSLLGGGGIATGGLPLQALFMVGY